MRAEGQVAAEVSHPRPFPEETGELGCGIADRARSSLSSCSYDSFGGFVTAQNADQGDGNITRARIESVSHSNPQIDHIRALFPDSELREAPALPPGHVNYTRYRFLHFKGATTLGRDDVAFLSSKGALAVPERGLMNEFIRQYFLQIHPSIPVLDEAQVWEIYEQRDMETHAGQISLYLFQALLFASCPVGVLYQVVVDRADIR